MKKRIFAMLLAGCMAASMVGCSGKGGGETAASTTAAENTKAAETSLAKESTEASAEAAEEASIETAQTTFTVGFDQDFPPMGFVGDDGEYTGFDLELAAEVAKRLGLEFVAQPIAWDSKDMELNSGNIDCIWNGFTINGREDDYAWTAPYMENSQVFVVAADSGITSWDDLAGKTVEVQVDSSAEAALKDNEKLTSTFGRLVTTPDYNTAFMDLEMGQVDAIAMDVIVAGYQIAQRDANFVILDEEISAEDYGIGFKLDNGEMRDKVQGALEEMAADGTLKAISEKWFSKDVTIIG